MLARLARHPFDSTEHFFELKWDGIRAMAFLEEGRLRLLSRTSRDITASFPELADLPGQVGARSVVLDGELVCLDSDGRPSFPLLQRRLGAAGRRGGRDNPVHFIAFDLLYLEGRSVMAEPLYSRKSRLHEIVRPSDMAQVCDLVDGDGAAFFQATCQHGLEGIVAKEKSSPYLPGRRSPHWLKVKRVRESEFVIGGYTFSGAPAAGAPSTACCWGCTTTTSGWCSWGRSPRASRGPPPGTWAWTSSVFTSRSVPSAPCPGSGG